MDFDDIPDFSEAQRTQKSRGRSALDIAMAEEGWDPDSHLAKVARSIYQQESGGGRNTKTSNAGAVGGMQIVPRTFSEVADRGWDIHDPVDNARAGLRYVRQGYDASGGDAALTGAYYYGGPGGLAKAQRGQAVFDPRNPRAPSTLQYGAQVASRVGDDSSSFDNLPDAGPISFDDLPEFDGPRGPADAAPAKPATKKRGVLASMVESFKRGLIDDVPEQVGQAVRFVSPDGSALDNWGRETVESARARAAGRDELDMEGDNWLEGALIKASRSGPQIATTMAIGAIPVVGPAAAAGTAAAHYGLSAGQTTEDKIVEQTGNYDKARQAGLVTAAIQGPLEGVATLTGLKAASTAAPVARNLLGRGAATTAQVVERATDDAVLKPFAKAWGKNMLVQPATEVAQDVGTEINERAHGAKPEDMGEIAGDSAQGGFGMALLLGPFAGYGAIGRARNARQLDQALNDPNVPADVRAAARDRIVDMARRQGVKPEDADAWLDEQFMADDARASLDEERRIAEMERRDAEEAQAQRRTWNQAEFDRPTPTATLDEDVLAEQGVSAPTPRPVWDEGALARGLGDPANPGTSPGAGGPYAQRVQTAPQIADLDVDTAPGAAPPRPENGIDYTREVDTGDLALMDNEQVWTPEEQARRDAEAEFNRVAFEAEQESIAQAQAAQQQAQAEQQALASRARAKRVVKMPAIKLWGEVEALHAQGAVSDGAFATATGKLAGDALGMDQVRAFVKNTNAQLKAQQREADKAAKEQEKAEKAAQKEAEKLAKEKLKDEAYDAQQAQAAQQAQQAQAAEAVRQLQARDLDTATLAPVSRDGFKLPNNEGGRALAEAVQRSSAKNPSSKVARRAFIKMGYMPDGSAPADGQPRTMTDAEVAQIEARLDGVAAPTGDALKRAADSVRKSLAPYPGLSRTSVEAVQRDGIAQGVEAVADENLAEVLAQTEGPDAGMQVVNRPEDMALNDLTADELTEVQIEMLGPLQADGYLDAALEQYGANPTAAQFRQAIDAAYAAAVKADPGKFGTQSRTVQDYVDAVEAKRIQEGARDIQVAEQLDELIEDANGIRPRESRQPDGGADEHAGRGDREASEGRGTAEAEAARTEATPESAITEATAAQGRPSSATVTVKRRRTVARDLKFSVGAESNTNSLGARIADTPEKVANFWRWYSGQDATTNTDLAQPAGDSGRDSPVGGRVEPRGASTVNAIQRPGVVEAGAGGADTVGGDVRTGTTGAFTVGGTVFPGATGPVGQDGAPVVFFHGTRDDITAFDTRHPNRKDVGWLGRGIYGTSSTADAEHYAGAKRGAGSPSVMPLYFAVKNPYRATPEEKAKLRRGTQDQADRFAAQVKARGHDGVILEAEDGSMEIVAFEPTQVKSASGNTGDFDGSNADIRFGIRADMSGSPAAAVITDLEALMPVNNRWVKVIQSEDDLPPALLRQMRAQQRSQGAAGRVQGFVDARGQAWLIADNIAPGQARSVFMHEVGSHVGLEGALSGPEFRALHNQVLDWADSHQGEEGELARRAIARAGAAGTHDSQMQSEVVAYFVEEAVNAGHQPSAARNASPIAQWLAKLRDVFSKALRKLNMDPSQLSAQDVVDLAYGAAYVQTLHGEQVNTGQGTLQFSVVAAQKRARAFWQDDRAKATQEWLGWAKDKAVNTVAFTHDLVDRAVAAGIPAARDYWQSQAQITARRQNQELALERLTQRFDELPQHLRGTGQGSVNTLLHDSTTSDKWAFQPDWLEAKVAVDPTLAKRFDAMPDKAKALVRDVFRAAHDNRERLKNAAMVNIRSEFDPLIAEAKKAGNAEEATRLEAHKARELREYTALAEADASKPYVPLGRFGDHGVVAMSAEYLAAEKAGDRTRLREMQSDPLHYRVEFVETKAEAIARRQQYGKAYAYADDFARSEVGRKVSVASDAITSMARLEKLFEDSDTGMDSKSMEKVRETMRAMKLALLSEQSARQAERKRLNVAGADKDMMRAFITRGRAMNHYVSMLESQGAVQEALQDMADQTRERKAGRSERQELFNELMKRHLMGMTYESSPLVSKITSLTSTWMLLTSPTYHALNALQVSHMSVPMLAGRYGYAGAWGQTLKAYGDVSKLGVTALRSHDFSALSRADQELLGELTRQGHIDIHLSGELGTWDSSPDAGPASNAMQTVSRKLTQVSSTVESINRVVTALAAARLERAHGGDQAAQVQRAADVIRQTHGDYTMANAPRFMRTNLGRVATQFRKFQLIQMSLYAKLVKQAFSKQPPEVQRMARTQLAYNLAHTMALGGAAGLPAAKVVAMVGAVMAGAFGDDYEPDDLGETKLREAVGDGWADLLLGGMPRLFGVNLSSRVGAGDVASPFPFWEAELSRQGAQSLALNALGPSAGLAANLMDAAGKAANGDPWALGNALPKGLADVVRAARMEWQGVTDSRGDVVLGKEDLNLLDSAFQAVGIRTAKLTDRSERASIAYKVGEHFKQAGDKVKRQYVEAVKDGDEDARQKAIAEWHKLQAARVRNGFERQQMTTLTGAVKRARERDANVAGGVRFRGDNEAFVRRLTREDEPDDDGGDAPDEGGLVEADDMD